MAIAGVIVFFIWFIFQALVLIEYVQFKLRRWPVGYDIYTVTAFDIVWTAGLTLLAASLTVMCCFLIPDEAWKGYEPPPKAECCKTVSSRQEIKLSTKEGETPITLNLNITIEE